MQRKGAWMGRAGRLGVTVLVALLGLARAEALAGQGGRPALEALDSLERIRDAAYPLWQAGDPRGRVLLEEAWAFLEDPEVFDLMWGFPELAVRRYNLAFERACARALAGDEAGALEGLRAMYEAGASPGFAAALEEVCPPLHELHEHPVYAETLLLWRSEDRRWSGETLATPYRDTLPAAERVAGLSLLWSTVRYSLPGFHTAPGLDLDSLYLAFLPRVELETSTLAYYRTLQRFVAALGDAHTNVYLPEALAPRVYGRPPLVTRPVAGEAVIAAVRHPALDRLGIAPGQVVVSVDGVPTHEYVREHVAPYVSSSTPQDREVRELAYQLLLGDEETPVRLGLRRPDGSTFEVEVPRSGYEGELRPLRANTDSILAGNIGYLRLDEFASSEVRDYVVQAMERLADTRGLVIDVRNNGGGSSSPGYRLLTTLVDTAFSSNPSWIRDPDPLERARGRPHLVRVLAPGRWEPHETLRYREPVVVLAGPMTFSAAEDFVAAFAGLGRGTIVGEATGGNTGQPLVFPLPGGGRARVRTKHDVRTDGVEFIGVGVPPDVVVEPTVEDVAAGRDPVLEEALRILGEAARGR